jgi:hypothetical protein
MICFLREINDYGNHAEMAHHHKSALAGRSVIFDSVQPVISEVVFSRGVIEMGAKSGCCLTGYDRLRGSPANGTARDSFF